MNVTEILLNRFENGKLKIDLGGHLKTNPGPVLYNNVNLCFIEFICAQIGWLIETHLLDSQLTDYEAIDLVLDSSEINEFSTITCDECGKREKLKYKNKTIYIDSQCSVPGGLKPWDIEMDVPSGKLVFMNDMRNLFPTEERFYVNYTYEVKKCEEHYAKLGMFHIFVGNSNPSIYNFDDKVVIGYYENDSLKDKFKCGVIGTDLWWVSACDYDEFIRRNGSAPLPESVVVDLKCGPGSYRLTSYYSASKDPYELQEFAIIKKIKGIN